MANQHLQISPFGRPTSVASSRRQRSPLPARKDGVVGQASWFSSVVNLVNTIVGAGTLAMPLAFSHMGMLPGTFVILWAGLTAGFGLYLQTRCARYLDRGSASFFALSQITYPRASIVFDAAIAIKCFGVGVSYLIIIGDLMPGVVLGLSSNIDLHGFLMDRRFWITAFMLIVIPFSFLRRLDSLKYTSFVALVSIGYLVILVVAHCIIGDTRDQRGAVRILTWQSPAAFLASLPVMVFAYTCHQNMFSILNEMSNPTSSQTLGVVTTSMGISGLIYAVVAVTGYISYGDNVTGNIVRMYLPSASSTIGKAAIVVLVMFSYALQVHPCRASVDAVLRWRPSRTGRFSGPHNQTSASRPDSMSEIRFAIITTAIVVLSYIVAITVSSLEKVLAYVGATGSTTVSFILPGLFYYKISAPDSAHHQRLLKADDDEEESETISDEDSELSASGVAHAHRPVGWRKGLLRNLSLALASYGILVMVVCLITNTFFIASGH